MKRSDVDLKDLDLDVDIASHSQAEDPAEDWESASQRASAFDTGDVRPTSQAPRVRSPTPSMNGAPLQRGSLSAAPLQRGSPAPSLSGAPLKRGSPAPSINGASQGTSSVTADALNLRLTDLKKTFESTATRQHSELESLSLSVESLTMAVARIGEDVGRISDDVAHLSARAGAPWGSAAKMHDPNNGAGIPFNLSSSPSSSSNLSPRMSPADVRSSSPAFRSVM